MAQATVDGLSISYEVIGEVSGGGRRWAITPGGRFSKDYPGVRELAVALAGEGNQVLIWDRPNCGESDVCFTGASESAMQADTLAALLTHLDMAPAVISGGSGGSRVSMLTAARHPEVASGLALWWISGGAFGLMSLGLHYCGQSLVNAWKGAWPTSSPSQSGRRCSSGTRRTANGSSTRTAGSSSRRWNGGCWPTARAATSSFPGCRAKPPAPSTSPPWCSAAVRATRTTRVRRRSRLPRCSRTRDSWSRRGVTASGSNADRAREPGREPLRPLVPPRTAAHRVVAGRVRLIGCRRVTYRAADRRSAARRSRPRSTCRVRRPGPTRGRPGSTPRGSSSSWSGRAGALPGSARPRRGEAGAVQVLRQLEVRSGQPASSGGRARHRSMTSSSDSTYRLLAAVLPAQSRTAAVYPPGVAHARGHRLDDPALTFGQLRDQRNLVFTLVRGC